MTMSETLTMLHKNETVDLSDRDHDQNDRVVEKPKQRYYSIDRINSVGADYNLIVGQRGNGKTYSLQEHCIKTFLETGKQTVCLRRWVEDTKASNVQNMLDGNLLANLNELSNGKYTTAIFKANWFYLANVDEKGKIAYNENDRFMFVWNVSESERLKGQSFPNVTNIVFEEFISLSQMGYIAEETTLFFNIVSTIVRSRTDVKVWLLGNSVNPYNPYFDYFGVPWQNLKHGELWTKKNVFGGVVAVEFCENVNVGDRYGTADKYYCWGNNDSVSNMIVGGMWQLPNVPIEKRPNGKILYEYVILFDNQRLSLKIVRQNMNDYYCHVKTLKEKETVRKNSPVLCLTPSKKANHYTSFENLPSNKVNELLADLVNNSKVWFTDNMTGAYFTNFITQSRINR